jgi:transposase
MTNPDLIRKTYRFQLRPTKRQADLLDKTLGVCCELYNDALHERRDAMEACSTLGLLLRSDQGTDGNQEV